MYIFQALVHERNEIIHSLLMCINLGGMRHRYNENWSFMKILHSKRNCTKNSDIIKHIMWYLCISIPV